MSAGTQRPQSRKFIKIHQVTDLCGLSKAEVYKRIAIGNFPKQINLGPRCVAWIEAEVVAWVEARITESRGEAA